MNSLAQFKKCLFLIEPQSLSEKTFEYRKILREIEVMNTVRQAFVDNSDNHGITKLELAMKEAAVRLEAMLKKKNIEELGNRLVIEQMTGSKVQFGQTIQLKQLFTGKYLSILPMEISDKDNGFLRVGLDYLTPHCWIKLIPTHDSKQFESELLFNQVENIKLSTLIGGHISTKESFLILNSL